MNEIKHKKSLMTKGLVISVFILVVIICVITIFNHAGGKKINNLLDMGDKYLEEMDYDNAVLVFDQAIAIDPKCEEAYLGKAQALYAQKQYEDAVATLEAGISKVDDSAGLEKFLKQILLLISGENSQSVYNGTTKPANTAEKGLLLSYIEIVRFTDTQEPNIQLEVLGDEGNGGKYIWESSYPEYAAVSDTGLVTCRKTEGTTIICAKDEYGNESEGCTIRICASDNGFGDKESETVKVKTDTGNAEKDQDYVILVAEDEGKESATVDVLGKHIYYSGDIVIPEVLQFNGKEIPVTGLSGRAFRWSDNMDSIYIPATIEDVGIQEHEKRNPFYYCTNLKEINVDENSKFFKAIEGVLYSKDGTVLYSYPAGKTDSSYTLPKEVETVCSGAFLGCSNLKEILVEEGNEYFESDGVSLVDKKWARMVAYSIGNDSTSYVVPDSVKHFEPDVFYSSKLEEIDCNLVEWIQEDAFPKCDKLKRIGGGEGTTSIYWVKRNDVIFTGFGNMKKLEKMTISLAEGQDLNEFSELEKLKGITIKTNGQPIDLSVLSGLSRLSELEVRGLDELEDLLWLEGMDSIYSMTLEAKKFEITDITPLYSLDNLQYIRMEGLLSDEMRQQIEDFKIQRPEVNVRIGKL